MKPNDSFARYDSFARCIGKRRKGYAIAQILTILGMLGVGLGFGSVVLSDPPIVPIAQAPASPDATESEEPLNAPYVPTPQIVVDRMLEMATVGSDDVVYDLGSGDGRLVITAAKNYGARGVGIEINSRLIEQSNANAQAAGVADRVEFRQEDLFQADFSDATVVTLYLLPEVNLQLRPLLLEQLRPGTQIVSHGFDMGDWEPEEVVTVQGPNRLHIIYRWTVPEEIPEYLRQSPSSQ